MHNHFSDQIIYSDLFEIQNEIFEYVSRNPQTIIEKIRLEHVHVEDLALRTIMNVCRNKLKSGEMHDRSGGLTASGNRLIKLVRSGMDESVSKGFLEQDQVDRIFKSFKNSL
jgi:hypothetical protein